MGNKRCGRRKVKRPQLVYTLSKEFMLLAIIASVLAVPMTWYFGKEWLQNFAYRMEIVPIVMSAVLFGALLSTLLMVVAGFDGSV